MESNKIEQLLEKYLDAKTTLQEEATLQEYFVNGNVTPHLQEYQVLFGYFADSKTERYTKTIQLNTKKTNWKWLSVAVSAVLLFSMYTGYQNNQKKQAKEALAKTQYAFRILSNNINKGTVAIGHLGTYKTTTNKIFKQPKK